RPIDPASAGFLFFSASPAWQSPGVPTAGSRPGGDPCPPPRPRFPLQSRPSRQPCPGPSMSVSFVHLRLHTEFSLVDGLVRVKPLVKAVAAAGMPAVAVTEISNMHSLVQFYKAANGAGIKPICGADIWVASRDEDGPLSRMTLLVMNAQGYLNLTELVS